VIFKSRIPQVLRDIDVRTQAAVAATAELVKQTAVSRVPVDQGDLRDSIEVKETESPFKRRVVAGSGNTFYGHFQEFGTEKMPAQPFMTPAAEDAKGQFVAQMKQIL
jgi:HK97 gp10 family phage protein